MTKQQLIDFGPLILAAYASATTLVFLAIVGRLAPSRKGLVFHVQLLWTTLTIVPSIGFIRWYAAAIGINMGRGVCSGEQFGRMVILVALGLFAPMYGVFGFVACNFPLFWQHYNAHRPPPNSNCEG